MLATCGFAVVAAALYAPHAAEAACTSTSFIISTGYGSTVAAMTAVLVNPAGTVSGDVDATGCDIGVYYGPGKHGHINGANVHGAKYHGVVNDGARVEIENSSVSDIGNLTSGESVGYGIFFWGGTNAASGDIHNNTVWHYQKNGIVVANHASAEINNNSVMGDSQTARIAQNGIEIGFGGGGQVRQNFVSGHAYTGPNVASSAAILVVGGACYQFTPTTNTVPVTDINVEQNTAVNNDVGVLVSNLDASCQPISTPTKNSVSQNTLVNNAITNTSGNSPTQGYQAGIADSGDGDVIKNNDVCGLGYTPPGSASAALFDIDVTFTNNPIVKNNTNCSAPRRHRDEDFDHHRHGHWHF